MTTRNTRGWLLRLAGFTICLVACIAEVGICKSQDYLTASTLFFPETNSWTPIREMGIADGKFLRKNEFLLRSAYSQSKLAEKDKRRGCSEIDKIFSEKYDFPKNFYLEDVDADGQADIAYSGPAQCEEGDSTIIWFGGKAGFAIRQETRIPLLAVRIERRKSPRLSYVAAGCCDSDIDEYYLGDLSGHGKVAAHRITKNTQLPATSEKPISFKAEKVELVLRETPAVDNTINQDKSEAYKIQVHGNILTKFSPGCTGRIVSRHINDRRILWYFVITDKSCKRLSTQGPSDVNAGWVETANIRLN